MLRWDSSQLAFPASCPFMMSVGGTVGVPETAVTRFGSGGGFSNFFPRPAYQDAAVAAFLKVQGHTNKGLFNPNGRDYPDIAAQGDNFETSRLARAPTYRQHELGHISYRTGVIPEEKFLRR
ncbi:hypothetical protein K439DRAFT_34781 [Ramaria rubella]|nr:hypothetical protein K439DRAFT_34781 [Ramaria rubella]